MAIKSIIEALLFQSAEPIEEKELQAFVGGEGPVLPVLEALQRDYAERGIRLEQHGTCWAFRTAPEVSPHLTRAMERSKRLSRAGLETLAIIAYQQPVTRADIEAVRGTSVSAGTLDLLVEAGWVTPKGRRETAGRPVLWGTTSAFLDYFDLRSLSDLPRLDELEAAGLFRPLADGDGDRAKDEAGAEPAPHEPDTSLQALNPNDGT